VKNDANSSDPEFLAAYGEAVQVRRDELGLDRKQLADLTGISYSYLSAIESGERLPSGTYQLMLTNGLRLTPAELLARANGVVREPIRARYAQGPPVGNSQFRTGAQSGPLDEEPPNRVVTHMSRTSSGVMAELEVLLPNLGSEDQDLVLGMVRRLAGAQPPPRRRVVRDARWRGSTGRGLRTEAYLRFWTMYLEAIEVQGLDWTIGRRAEPRSYFTTSSPVKGSSLSASFARNRLLRHEMYINRGSREANIDLLKELEANRSMIEETYGATLDFEDPGRERRAVRIAEYRDGHISQIDEFESYVDWFIDRGVRMRRALQVYVEDTVG